MTALRWLALDPSDELLAFLQAEFFEPIAHAIERLVLRAAWEKNTDAVRLGRLGDGAIDERERPNNAKKKCLGNHKFWTAFRQGCIGTASNQIFWHRFRERTNRGHTTSALSSASCIPPLGRRQQSIKR